MAPIRSVSVFLVSLLATSSADSVVKPKDLAAAPPSNLAQEMQVSRQDDRMFEKFDENKDGKLSKEELFDSVRGEEYAKMIANFEQVLPRVDQDGDKLISKAELPALLAIRRTETGEDDEEGDEEDEEDDEDDDEEEDADDEACDDKADEKEDDEACDDDATQAQQKERRKKSNEQFKKVFQEVDLDKDGKLSAEEVSAMGKHLDTQTAEKVIQEFGLRLKKVDKNADSLLSIDEISEVVDEEEEKNEETDEVVKANSDKHEDATKDEVVAVAVDSEEDTDEGSEEDNSA